ncbi:amino acid deaminase/aldolase [Lentibacillus saliphilus]|uniref:amino acid deaminase/aldolase n=1 Tax=Lentibacillus saliphilus TaxID=2737028 RepID=UPI001C2F77AB|nr:amino acid deaminase/aldolase [Lentibacillus saliphilus]
MSTYDYFKQALKDVSKPCAFIEMTHFDTNIQRIAAQSNGKTIRIASKSIRSIDVLNYIFNSSPIFQGVMCYAADEALYLNDNGFDDLLIAYPTVNQTHLKKIAQRTKNNQTITVMVDSTFHIDLLETIAKETDSHFLTCLDIDLSTTYPRLHFGVHRSPVKTTEHAMALINRILHSKYLTLDGIMGYEAQIAGVTDNNPKQKTKNSVIRMLKKHASKEIIKKRAAIRDAIQEKRIPLRFVNGGGTGSLKQTAQEDAVTEMTVGSGFFNPHLFDDYVDHHNEPAMGFAIDITRRPSRHIYTCAGGGYIASGAVGEDRLPRVYLPKGATLTANEGAGEVQTPIYYEGDVHLEIGDPIFMRHSKAGELCEHFHDIHLIKEGQITGTYRTYRGDHKCFL